MGIRYLEMYPGQKLSPERGDVKADHNMSDADRAALIAKLKSANVTPTALNVNSDGMADLAMFVNQSGTTSVQWLKTIERTTVPASMTNAGQQPINVTLGPGVRLF